MIRSINTTIESSCLNFNRPIINVPLIKLEKMFLLNIFFPVPLLGVKLRSLSKL